MNRIKNLISLALILFSPIPSIADDCDAKVAYFDRNDDLMIDLEKHEFTCLEDSGWELQDNDFDEFYERRIDFGIGPISSDVNPPIPVPMGDASNET